MSFFIITCFQALLLLIYLAYKYSTYHYGHWKKFAVPHTKPTPLFGHFRETIMGRQHTVELIRSLYYQFENHRYFGIFEVRNPTLVLRDPELVHTVMVKDFGSFCDRRPDKTSFEYDELFDNLVHLRGDKWRAVRSKLTPTFTATKLKSMLGEINICLNRLMDSLDEQTSNNNGKSIRFVISWKYIHK